MVEARKKLRRASACVGLFLAVPLCFAQAFGRFGYTEKIAVASFDVSRVGFQTKHAASDAFRWENPSTWWRPLATSEYQQVVGLSGVGRSPSKARFDLFEPGFALYFGTGMGLHTASTAAPYLSWSEGSVGPGVPTPKVSWVMLSFRNAQPPLVLAFLGAPAALTLTGRSGDWILRADTLYQGWVRVVAPLGTQGFSANSAGELGRLVKEVAAEAEVWTEPAPQLLGVQVSDEPTAVTATWTFDRPGALVPTPITLAPYGAYPLKLQSRTRNEPLSSRMPAPLRLGTAAPSKSKPSTTMPEARTTQMALPSAAFPAACRTTRPPTARTVRRSRVHTATSPAYSPESTSIKAPGCASLDASAIVFTSLAGPTRMTCRTSPASSASAGPG